MTYQAFPGEQAHHWTSEAHGAEHSIRATGDAECRH